MRIHYTGRNAAISENQKQKLQGKFEKVHKILGRRHGSEAHVIVKRQRYLYDTEVTLNALSHTLVVSATNVDAFVALLSCLDKLEKQVIKNKHRLIDGRRPERQRGEPSPSVEVAIQQASEAAGKTADRPSRNGPRVVHSRFIEPKPLTLEGAMIVLDERDRDQVTYRDAQDGNMRVLLRRRDGSLELIEAF